EPTRPLHQGADRRAVALPGDQVALPVPGDLTVGRLLGPLVDHRHVYQPTATLLAPAPPLAPRPAGAQHLGQIPAQPTTQLRAIDGLVDRLRHEVAVRLVGE